MKVLHFIPVYAPAWQFGGPVLSVSRLCEGLAAKGIDVEVVTTNAGLAGNNEIQLGMPLDVNGVKVTYFPVNSPHGVIQSRELQKSLPSILHNVDLLHISAIWQPTGIQVQKAAIQRSIPIIHTVRGALSPYSLSHGWWKKWPYLILQERRYLEKATILHITSRQEGEEISRLALTARQWLLPNPVCIEHLRSDKDLRNATRKEFGLNQSEPLLLICGRQHHKKGLDLLPDVLDAVRDMRWKLLLIGSDSDGSGASFLNSLDKLGLSDRVIIRSTVPAAELCRFYNAADLLLLPSRHENFGNVVVEALVCGCCIAVSDKTGVGSDLLSDAPGGYGAVLPRNKDSWIAWLRSWLNSPYRAASSPIEWVSRQYSQAMVADGAIQLYERILKSQQNQ